MMKYYSKYEPDWSELVQRVDSVEQCRVLLLLSCLWALFFEILFFEKGLNSVKKTLYFFWKREISTTEQIHIRRLNLCDFFLFILNIQKQQSRDAEVGKI